MNPAIIIPTYYSNPKRAEHGGVTTTYDHKTPLGSPGELPRLLKSLAKVQGVGQIIVLVAADKGANTQAELEVQKIANKFPSLSIAVIGNAEKGLIRQRFKQLGLGELSHEVGLSGYSAIRNLGLVVACVMGFDAVVFLDDDEVIDDADFMKKAVYGLGKLTRKGVPILAKTGFYFNSEGTYLSKSQNVWYNHFWQQGRAFNAWITKALNGPRLQRSNHVCGGCLAIHKQAFMRMAFDPWVSRGEDLDYMFNLRMYGSDIWFDNTWNLHHLPPASTSEGRRFRQDIYRWLYEFRKLEYSRTQIDLMQIKPQSLVPYPGPFLKPGITNRIRITAILRSFAREDGRAYRQAARSAKTEATEYAQNNCQKYFEFQYVWPRLTSLMECDKITCDALIESVNARQAKTLQGKTPNRVAPKVEDLDPGATTEIRLNLDE